MNKREQRALFKLDQNSNSNVKNVVAIVSGKGGVGKSLITSLLTSAMNKRGYKTAILDADITGPSIPKAFGLSEKLKMGDRGLSPSVSKNGTKIVSTNLLIDEQTSAVVWRSPILTAAIRQFWQDVSWGDVDFMFVDLPPGTSDPQLTIFQSIPLLGIIVVTSPQEIVSIIVEKAMDMANKLSIPVIGVIENFSYFEAPDTGVKYEIFGKSKTFEIFKERGIKILDRLPINPDFASLVDQGKVEEIDSSLVSNSIDEIIQFEKMEAKDAE